MSPQVSSMLIRGRAGLAVNKPNEPVPPGWVWVPVNSVARQETGHTPSRSHPEWWGGDIPWIGIRDARLHHGGVIHDTLQTTNPLGLANSSARLLPKGTVCLSRTASVGYVTIMGRDMATSQDFVTWTCSEALVPDFLVKALIAEGEGLRKFGKGTTHTTIYFPEIRALHICLPPLAEQNRIVAKLDALNAKSARARTELARIETLVSRYKQAVLSKAFSGELTREWRNNQPSTTGWPKAVISDIAEVVTGSTPKTAEKERFFGGDTPFFKPTDLDQGYYVETPRETLSAAGVAVSRLVPALSVLVTCIGATIGKVGFARVACCTNQQINALVPKIALAKPEWLYWVVSSPEFQAIIIDNSSATTLPIINKGRFQQLPLGLPPLEEQHEIVRRIESAFAKIDRLAKEAKRALELVGRLDEAILAKAFRGELVPQDDNDEPAEHLLARIRAERDKAPKARRGRGAKG